MRTTQTWIRNDPTSDAGESLTVSVVFSSFDKNEIDNLELKMSNGAQLIKNDRKKYEIIHCMHCAEFDPNGVPESGCGFCELLHKAFRYTDFCSYGEKRIAEGDILQ